MKKIGLLLMSALFVMFTVVGAVAQEKAIRLTKFEGKEITGVRINAPFTVDLSQGKNTKAVVEISPELEEYLIFVLEKGVLHITFKYDNNPFFQKKFSAKNYHMRATVVVSKLNKLNFSTAARITANGTFTGDNVEMDGSSGGSVAGLSLTCSQVDVEASSAASVSMAVTASKVETDASSGARIVLNGTANDGNLEASSGASVEGSKLALKLGRATASSGASITINASEQADLSASSGAAVRYVGSPKQLNKKASSGGRISTY